jgi:leucyl aminopeptidase (aminopeptidase T)
MSIELTIHGTGTGPCSLTGKEGEGMTVTFKDGTVKEAFLSQRAFMQLVRMKAGPADQPVRVPTRPAPTQA